MVGIEKFECKNKLEGVNNRDIFSVVILAGLGWMCIFKDYFVYCTPPP